MALQLRHVNIVKHRLHVCLHWLGWGDVEEDPRGPGKAGHPGLHPGLAPALVTPQVLEPEPLDQSEVRTGSRDLLSTNHSSPGTTAAPWPACSCSWPRSPRQPGLGARYKYINNFVSRLCPAPTLAATPIMSPNLGCQTATNLKCSVDIIDMCRYDGLDIYRL